MAGLYVHIPFCHSKCSYCDFYSTADKRRIDELLETIPKEYEYRQDEIKESYRTVYFGGGTPSIIDTDKLYRLCEKLPTKDAVEFTIEANPEDISTDKIEAWRAIGINRISMGIQSLNDAELRSINRRHDSQRAIEAIEKLLAGGIDNISCDLIYGLPGQDIRSWDESLTRLIEYNLPHLSAYCLSYEPGTVLYAKAKSGKIIPTDDETLEQMYVMLCKKMSEAGYEHYEISNFAKPGKKSMHNSSYWDSTPYIGLGPGAHSFDRKTRRYNPSNLKSYIENFPTTVIDEENELEQYNDTLITSLRTAHGIDLSSLPHAMAKKLLDKAMPFVTSKAMEIEKTHLRICEAAWFRSDGILRELIEI